MTGYLLLPLLSSRDSAFQNWILILICQLLLPHEIIYNMKNGRNSTVSFVWTLLLQHYTLMSPKLNCTLRSCYWTDQDWSHCWCWCEWRQANDFSQFQDIKTITVYVHLLFPIVVDGALFECWGDFCLPINKQRLQTMLHSSCSL